MEHYQKLRSTWVVCPICSEEYRARTAKICPDCKERATAYGFTTEEWLVESKKTKDIDDD